MLKNKSGYTILEILFALAVFSLVIISVVNFMTRTNVEVGTATNQSIANERCTLLLNQISSDVRAAKRASFVFQKNQSPISSFAFLKYIENKDDKKSDKTAVEKIIYKLDKNDKFVSRFAIPVKFDKDGKFKNDGKAIEKRYENFVQFEVMPQSTDGSDENIQLMGFIVSTAIENNAIGHAQTWTDKTTVYIRDQNYYDKQPHWNENALYTSSIVSVTKGKLLLPDFSDFTKAWTWVKDLGNQIPDRINELGKDIFEATRQQMAKTIFEKSDALKNEFLSNSSVSSVVKKAKSKLTQKVYKAFGKKREYAIASMFLNDKIYDKVKGIDIYKKLMEKKLSDNDITDFLVENKPGNIFNVYKLPVISKMDINFLNEFKKEHTPSNSDKVRAGKITKAINDTKNDLYKAVGKDKDFNNFLAAFSKVMTDEVTDKIHDKAIDYVQSDVVNSTVDKFTDEATESLKNSLGIKDALESSNLDPKVKNELDKILTKINSELSKGKEEIKNKINKEIKTGEAQNLGNLSNTAVDSINSANDTGQESVKDIDSRRVADGLKDVPDPVNSAIINVSDQILSGRIYSESVKDFIPDKDSINYLDKLYEDFGIKPPGQRGL